MAANKGKKVVRKRRERKNVERGQVHIRSSFNNTMVTVTDAQGNYAIDVPKQGTLVFSFIGMLPYQTTVGGGVTKIDVTLKEDVARLDEVVVIGYGNQRRADVTAAVSQIDGKDLQLAPMTNISQGLAGRMSGLISLQSSGQPGSDQASMTIRGAKSGILYIVDGVPRSINDIDPNDVESVTLLKDGAAVAVYGLEGAGGVMIVTTKRGKQGSMSLTYKGSYGASFNTSYPSSRFLESGSYFRLKNLQIGYSLPEKMISRAGFKSCRVYLQGSNLFTATKYSGFDPEVNGGVDNGNYPQSRSFLIGVNISY